MNNDKISSLIEEMKQIQLSFYKLYGVDDIWSNSKIFEIIIANDLNHNLIPGHSGSKDASDSFFQYEYKHFKESSSNHSWTFNDYSEDTIQSLKNQIKVIFAHINDSYPYSFDWYYEVPGLVVAEYLEKYTKEIQNTRKMINISPNQIESRMGYYKIKVTANEHGFYSRYLNKIFEIIHELECYTNTKNLLTSNKFWELLVALKLGHSINSEQGGREGAHDAYDKYGNTYEYKISKNHSWNFQDISENVLKKYYDDEAIILGVVDKKNIEVLDIFSAEPKDVVPRLEEKLKEKQIRANSKLRRLQVSLSKGDLLLVKAKHIYKK